MPFLDILCVCGNNEVCMKKIKLKVIGMTCVHCAKSVESAIEEIGATAHVNLASGITIITSNEGIDEMKIRSAIKSAGYEVEDINAKHRVDLLFIELIVGLVFALPLLYAHLHHFGLHVLVPDFLMNVYVQFTLATILQFGIGWRFYKRAFYNLLHKTLGMDVLVVIATTAAYALSVYGMLKNKDTYFECAAVVIAIINLGHYVESNVKKRTGKSLEKLIKLQAKDAYLIVNDERIQTPIAQVNIGDVIEILAQEIIPIDGILIDQEAVLDESLISGESRLIKHAPGDIIHAGTVNAGASLRIRVNKSLDDSTLGQIIDAVEQATTSKPPLQKTADRISNVFVPLVIALSILAFLYHYYIAKINLDDAIINAVSVLVVSCPCALGLAVPMSVMVGYNQSAKEGILFKSGDVFEYLKSIDTIFFDKTGTLTEGNFSVNSITGDEEYLPLLLALEKDSTHPLALSICKQFSDKFETIKLEVSIIPGVGNECEYAGDKYLVSGTQFIKENNNTFNEFISEASKNMWNVVCLYKNDVPILLLGLGDKIKTSSFAGIKALNEQSIETCMLSGDNAIIANAVASLVGIKESNIFSGVKPIEKAEIIKNVQLRGHRVAFVGDGINDAVALETADLGIAMAQGSDIAISSADVTLLNKDMRSIAKTVTIAKRIYQNIKQNFMWALLYNIIMIPLAFFGYLSPMISAIAMVLSNIIVVLNSLRLKRKRKE